MAKYPPAGRFPSAPRTFERDPAFAHVPSSEPTPHPGQKSAPHGRDYTTSSAVSNLLVNMDMLDLSKNFKKLCNLGIISNIRIHGQTEKEGFPSKVGERRRSMRTTTKSPKRTYRSLLLKKRDELLASTRSEPEALSASVQSPDAVEFAVRTVEQDVTVVDCQSAQPDVEGN